VDDTVIEKPHAKRLNEAGWVWSSKHNKAVYGVSVVLLVWSDGQLRIPISFRVWKKGGPSKGVDRTPKLAAVGEPDVDGVGEPLQLWLQRKGKNNCLGFFSLPDCGR
jgi:hypothetical protein